MGEESDTCRLLTEHSLFSSLVRNVMQLKDLYLYVVFSGPATCQEGLLRACKKDSQNWELQMRTYFVLR